METIEPACRQDLPEVERLYRQLCDEQAGDPYTPMWEYGLHPDTEMLERHIENGELWIARVDGGSARQIPAGVCRKEGTGRTWDCICWELPDSFGVPASRSGCWM